MLMKIIFPLLDSNGHNEYQTRALRPSRSVESL